MENVICISEADLVHKHSMQTIYTNLAAKQHILMELFVTVSLQQLGQPIYSEVTVFHSGLLLNEAQNRVDNNMFSILKCFEN